MLAMELLPAIRAKLDELGRQRSAIVGGQRAALWRAQQHAAHTNHTIEDLRLYCLEALKPRSFLSERDENDYLRGFRQGFQTVLREIRRVEGRRG
jgi:hypothetical protein